MKKLLLCTIMFLLVVLIGVTAVKGIKIGKLDILGISAIKEKNDELDKSIKEATKIASTDYQKEIADLNEAIKKLENEKIKYEDMVNVRTESEVQAANQTYDNLVEFLFVRIENHAKSEGVKMKMEVVRSSSGAENVYDLNFTVTGAYIQIEEFITDIEDDSKLGYKIEKFKMTTASENEVQATFVCKDIKISGISSNTNINTNTNVNTNSDTNTNTTQQ